MNQSGFGPNIRISSSANTATPRDTLSPPPTATSCTAAMTSTQQYRYSKPQYASGRKAAPGANSAREADGPGRVGTGVPREAGGRPRINRPDPKDEDEYESDEDESARERGPR